MTNFLWDSFILFFAHDISRYRLELPPDIRNQEMVLIVDCHVSRISSFAVEYLKLFNIILNILPPHTTHILQPFDVCVARSLKSNILKLGFNPLYQFQNLQFQSKRQTIS